MADQYGGNPSNTAVVQIPDDNDVADAESVDVGLRQIWDSIKLGLDSAYRQPMHSVVRVRSTDGLTAKIEFIPSYIQNIKAFAPYQYAQNETVNTITVSASDLDITPKVFAINSVYYVYAQWNGTAFVGRVGPGIPDETLCFLKATPGPTRYLGAIFTDSAGSLFPVHKSEGFYTFDRPPVLIDTTSDTAVDFNLVGKIPTYCRKVRLRIALFNSDATNDDTGFISAPGGTPIGFDIGRGLSVWNNFYMDLPLLGTQIRARMNSSTGKGRILVSLQGMWES